MTVAFFPYTNKSNYYVNIIQNAIREEGFDIVPIEEADALECKAVILNWYEDIYNKNPIHGFQAYHRKKRRILELQKSGKKIIYVMHDKKPHNSTFAIWAYLMKRFLIKHSDRIVILCKETKAVMKQLHIWFADTEEKTHIIPHPNYIGCYDPCKYNFTREKLGIEKDTIVLLHLGGIAKYKNNDLILDAAAAVQNKNIVFIIAGPAPNNRYTDKIKRRISQLSNVIPIYGFIPDDEIAGLIQCSDALLIPHDIRSSLNSGTVFMAFSYHRTVICPEIGTIKDLQYPDLCLSYSYKTKQENRKQLIHMIEVFYQKYYNKRENLNILNEKVFDYVKNHHNNKEIGKLYKDIILK